MGNGTRVYGYSDDLIAFEGDMRGEVGCFGTDDRGRGVLVVMSDGTLLEVKYGKGSMGIWGVVALRKGPLFDRIDACTDEDSDGYSDVAHFKPGITGAYAAKDWDAVS